MKTVHFNPIGVTFETIDKLARMQETDAIALYMAYSAVGHWQQTFQPRATKGFMCQRIGWTEERFSRAKKVLKSLNLIEDIRKIGEDGKVEGWYIKINFLVNEATPPEIQGGGKAKGWESTPPSAINLKESAINLNKASEKQNFSEEVTYQECYSDGFTKQERKDFFSNRRRKALDVASEYGMKPEAFLAKALQTKDYPSRIIGLYINHKKMAFDNLQQLLNEFSRNLNTAHKLKCYEEKRITEAFTALDGKDYEWTLETVLKKINELKSKKKSKYNF